MTKKYYVYLLISLLLLAGCKTTNVSLIPYRKEYSKFVNDVAIMHHPESPQIDVDIRNDEMFISSLVFYRPLVWPTNRLPQDYLLKFQLQSKKSQL